MNKMDETKPDTVVNSEVKLKEISRKAKERKPTTPKKTPSPKPKGWTNFNFFLAGGLGAGMVILYLFLRKPKVEYRFVPAKKEKDDSDEKDSEASRLGHKKEEPSKTVPEFELNSF